MGLVSPEASWLGHLLPGSSCGLPLCVSVSSPPLFIRTPVSVLIGLGPTLRPHFSHSPL